MNQRTKNFKMLIGDDSYVDQRTAKNAISLILCGLAKYSGESVLEGEFVNDQEYFTPECPLEGFEGIQIRVAPSVREMIGASSGSYDWIVTDANYGEGFETGGITVLQDEGIRKNPAKKAIFTSEDNIKTLEKLVQTGADLLISPVLMNSSDHKSVLLGSAIADYYAQMNIGGKK